MVEKAFWKLFAELIVLKKHLKEEIDDLYEYAVEKQRLEHTITASPFFWFWCGKELRTDALNLYVITCVIIELTIKHIRSTRELIKTTEKALQIAKARRVK